MPKRREAIKQMLILVGGATILPAACTLNDLFSSKEKNIYFSNFEKQLLSSIIDTLIPSTNTPGAMALSVDTFVCTMIKDCYDYQTQQSFLTGLKNWDAEMKQHFSSDFLTADASTKQLMLQSVYTNSKPFTDEIKSCYNLLRTLTIQGYMTTEYVMTKQLGYVITPGSFHGCVAIHNHNS